jgi:DNA-binding transcriptional regulator YiaG
MDRFQVGYRMGQILAEIEGEFFEPVEYLPPEILIACTERPGGYQQHLSKVWKRAAKLPSVVELLDGFDPPAGRLPDDAQGSVMMGYYRHRAARKLPPSFPARLTSLRTAAGLSIPDLARSSGLSDDVIRRYETGDRAPTWESVQKLAAALGVPTDTFRSQ